MIAAFALFFIVLMSGAIVGAEDSDEQARVTKAYACLNNKINGVSSLGLEEALFSVIALGNNQKAVSTVDSQKGSDCWPAGNCNLKSTAQAAIAYNRLGRNTAEIINWILSKNATASGLRWYLQITIPGNQESSCTINYGGGSYSVNVGADLKLSGSSGSCLQIAPNGYRMTISDSCLNNEFRISCNKDFKTNLLYEKGSGGVTYVSYKTEDGPANGWAPSTKITARCFKTGSECDYEGSLWAINALYVAGNGREEFIPYLASLAPDNKKYFPDAFLYHVVGSSSGSVYYEGIRKEMKAGGYWEIPGSEKGKFFDTALALLALGANSPETANSKQYVLSIQNEDGCWNTNIRDIAFLLYALWPQPLSSGGVVTPPGGDGTTGGNCTGTCRSSCWANETLIAGNCTTSGMVCCRQNSTGTGIIITDPNEVTDCVLDGFFCVGDDAACLGARGEIKDKSLYACFPWTKSCCTVDVREQIRTCAQMSGSVCTAEETCKDATVSASDGACCLSTCEKQTGSCTGTCKASCSSGETLSNAQCPGTSNVCCVGGTGGGGGGSTWWIIILILLILIVLAVIGILYKDKIRLWWYKRQGKAKTSPYPGLGGGMMPRGPMPPQRILPRGVPRFAPSGEMRRTQPGRPAPTGRPASSKDKEMEETMKKLKEMSK